LEGSSNAGRWVVVRSLGTGSTANVHDVRVSPPEQAWRYIGAVIAEATTN
jgi:hypothetical protein